MRRNKLDAIVLIPNRVNESMIGLHYHFRSGFRLFRYPSRHRSYLTLVVQTSNLYNSDIMRKPL